MILFLVAIVVLPGRGQEVKDSVNTKIQWKGDFRFRVEHDWNSRKPDGSFRDDRSRLRYRLRIGFSKNWDQNWSAGARIRSGNIMDQQGPHLTIGGGSNAEFGLAQVGFEKAYLQYRSNKWLAWIGKQDYPFYKEHELLWNDNVFPEGMAAIRKWKKFDNWNMQFGGAYFILRSNGQLFNLDSYLLTAQTLQSFKSRIGTINYHIGILYFHQLPDVPDGQQNYWMDYLILTQSIYGKWVLGNKPLKVGADVYLNFSDYEQGLVSSSLIDQTHGVVACAKYGNLSRKGDWSIHVYWTYLERFAIVDFLAQNDWARWDYSSQNASGSRLSNMRGMELRLGWQITPFLNAVARFYQVDQLVPYGEYSETGTRFRIDLNAKF